MKRLLLTLPMVLLGLILCGCGTENPYEDAVNPVATILMEDGSAMRFELHLEAAPNTVANFTELANDRFYDGLEFFRVVPGVLIQSGCPNNDGTGLTDHTIRGEFSANGYDNGLSHRRGVLSMARVGGENKYNSASTQFFIMQGNYPEYDGQYAAFGTALDESTLTVLDAIGSQPVDAYNVPLIRQKIKSIRVNTHGLELEAQKIYINTPAPSVTPAPTDASENAIDPAADPSASVNPVTPVPTQTPAPTQIPEPVGTPLPPQYFFATSTPDADFLPDDSTPVPYFTPMPDAGHAEPPPRQIQDLPDNLKKYIEDNILIPH